MQKESKITLGIESSCDETSAAVLRDGREILANVIATQIPVHQKFGGVVPEIASRRHIVNLLPVVDSALQEAQIKLSDVQEVAVTYGPGLAGALLVGVAGAKALAFALDVPLIGVNHLEGHIFANFLSEPTLQPPFLALVASGGHTALIYLKDYESMELLGETRDDAAGEAFDKIARVMGLPYPGGPEIDRLAQQGNPEAIPFPMALMEANNFEFSFSGLKSAVLNYLNEKNMKHETVNMADVAASFQKAVTEALAQKALQAVKKTRAQRLVLAGGVAANHALRTRLEMGTKELGVAFSYPPPKLCTDNAAMIACRGYYMARAKKFATLSLNAVPSLSFQQ